MLRVKGEVNGRSVGLENAVFGNEPVTYEAFAPAVAEIRATDFRTLTDNFLCIYVTPVDVDWFSDCSALLQNARVAAQVAREAGLKGIVLDCEPYGFKLLDYRKVAHPERSFEEYYQQIRQRGEEFARAIYAEFPEMTLFLLFGYYVGDLIDPSQHHYGLYPAFLDGLFAASPEEAAIIDGWEMSYGYTRREQFLRAYWWIKDGGICVSRVPDQYRKKVRVGFGLWLDPDRIKDSTYTWEVNDFSRNYYSPAQMRSVLRYALETTDEYVWLFTGKIDVLTGRNLPPPYKEALWEAKDSLYGLSSYELANWAAWPETEAFAKGHELITKLPSEWRFRLDTYRDAAGWESPEYDDSEWLRVKTEDEWQRQLPFPGATGVGWARVRFDIPKECAGRRLFLWFGALDEEGDIYLNGEYVDSWTGDFDRGWETPFAVEITEQAIPGESNLLAVKVRADAGMGGVFRPVYLYSLRE